MDHSAHNQVALLPSTPAGLSLAAAEAIAARYPSPFSLLRAVRQAGAGGAAARLAALRCSAPRGGGRAVSEEQATRLLRLLFPSQEAEEEVIDLT